MTPNIVQRIPDAATLGKLHFFANEAMTISQVMVLTADSTMTGMGWLHDIPLQVLKPHYMEKWHFLATCFLSLDFQGSIPHVIYM